MSELAVVRGTLFFYRELRSRDYDSLEEELRHTDGCSHVMPGFTLVSSKRGAGGVGTSARSGTCCGRGLQE